MDDYLHNTKAAFNKAADNYDSNDFQNSILKWMRDIVHSVYLNYLKIEDEIFEINSGTGIDAVFLAQIGFNVFATDISENMINILRNKIKDFKLEDKINSDNLSFNEIKRIDKKKFNAVLSDFGGLNCINDFSELNKDICNLLEKEGFFIAVVMNKLCPWEIFYHSLKFDFKTAFRRFNKNGIYASLDDEKVKTYYFSPHEFGKYFRNNFKIIKIYSLGLFTPPPYLVNVYNRLRPIIKLMMNLDNLIKGLPLFNVFGDHFIIIMKKR